MLDSTRRLIQVLRSILRQLEASPEVDHSDPVMLDFKRTITQSIKDMEAREARAA